MGTNAGGEVPSDGHDGGGDEEFDLEQFKELAGFLARSPRRHPRLAAATLLLTLALGILVAIYWPRTYGCEVRILALRNLVLPALDNPTRQVPHDADAPTRNAADAILQRDNLISLVRQLDLVKRWELTRQPILRLKDKITGVFGTKNDVERERDMVDLVLKKLTVFADDSSITISVEWPDREMSFEIVSYLQKNFVEARHDTNVKVIVEALRILEERAKPQAAEVDQALAELTQLDVDRNRALRGVRGVPATDHGAAVPVPAPAPAAGPGGGAVTPRPATPVVDDTLAQELQEVRRKSRLMKEDHERQIAEAQRQLVDARATLGPMHPTVVGLNEKIGQLAETPAEQKALEARERELVAQIAAGAVTPSGVPSSLPRAPAPRFVPGANPPPVAQLPPYPGLVPADLRDDPQMAHARQKLQTASTKYNELLSRMEAANIELAVARAAFKYQYTVVRPPELARGPLKPNVAVVLFATCVLSLLLAFLLPGGLDLMRGRYMESWQVERSLKLPILGELTAPP